MTAFALARDPAIRDGLGAFLLLAVTRRARCTRVRTDERPDRVIDLRLVPVERRVTLRAATLRHLGRELRAVRVRVAVRARLLWLHEGEARSRAGMTAAARRRAMLAVERELRRRVLDDAEQRGREAIDGVALRALAVVALLELALVRVAVARRARPELQVAIALRDGLARLVTLRALDACVLARERIPRLAVIRAAGLLGRADPLDRRVAVLAVGAEPREVNRPVTARARAALGRWLVVAAIVALLARDARVAVREREPRVVGAHLVHGALPALGVVTRGARLRLELPLVRILVTALARRELERLPGRRRARVALLALDIDVLAGEREARELVIERLAVP